MKINFKKLKQLEDEIPNNPVSLRVIRDMIEILLHDKENNSVGYTIAYHTLLELQIIETNESKTIQQLNS